MYSYLTDVEKCENRGQILVLSALVTVFSSIASPLKFHVDQRFVAAEVFI